MTNNYGLEHVVRMWSLVQDTEREYLNMQRLYREVLDGAMNNGVLQKDISAAIGRHRDSLRLDRIQARHERDKNHAQG